MNIPEENSLQSKTFEKDKEMLMQSLMDDEDYKFNENFHCFKLQFENDDHFKQIFEENYFDYELLKAALVRKRGLIATILLNQGCRVSNPNEIKFEETPLYLSLANLDNISMFKKILNKGASIYVKNRKGETPLYIAFKQYHYEAVTIILNYISSCNLSFNPDNEDDVLHFHIACIRKHMSSIRVYLSLGFDANRHLSIDAREYYCLTPLFYLILNHFTECNIVEFVKVFINGGVDINSRVNSEKFPGFTALHFAVTNYSVELVELLLENSANPNKKNNRGETPLLLVCEDSWHNESNKIIEILLNNSASPVAIDHFKNTPIHVIFRRALDYPKKYLNVLDKLLSKQPLKNNLTNTNGFSLFHILCSRNEPDRVNELLNSGVKIDSCVSAGNFEGFTALHFAVYFNQKAVVELLLKRNALVNVKNDDMHTPLHLACEITPFTFYEVHEEHRKRENAVNLDWVTNRASQLHIIKLLLLNGADIEAKDKSDFTPLFKACRVNMSAVSLFPESLKNIAMDEIHVRLVEIINTLLSYKANIHWKSTNECSIIHIIIKNVGKISDELMECLITAGADINAVDKDGKTPLHLAAERSKEFLVQTLLKYKANINVKSKKFETPLEVAISSYPSYVNSIYDEDSDEYYDEDDYEDDYEDIALLECTRNCIVALLKNGSDINLRTEDGRSLLHIALSCSRPFIIQLLLDYGADINALVSSGYSVTSSFSINFKQYSMDVLCVIFIHVQKLLALGLHVNYKLEMFCTDLHGSCKAASKPNTKHIEIFNNTHGECISELNRMKIIKIDKYTSLYNVLLKDPHELSKYANNKTFTDILENENLDENFPLYKYLIELQYKKCLLRSDALEYAKESLNFAINSLSSSPLPDLCCDSILKNLTNEEVFNLKAAVGINGSRKRKANVVDLSELKQTIKVQKKD